MLAGLDGRGSCTASTNLDNESLLGAANLLAVNISDSTSKWPGDALTTESNPVVSRWRREMEFREGVGG